MQKYFLGFTLVLLTLFVACTPEAPLTPTTPNTTPTTTTTTDNSTTTTTGVICPEGFEIDEDSIPQFILDYVTLNHPNTNVDDATLLDDNGAALYGVELEDETQLLLDANGNLVAQGIENEIELSVDSLSANIIDYINTNYAGIAIEEAEQKDEYGNTYIEVELENEVSLIFDIDGNFLCTENDDDDDDDDHNGNGNGGNNNSDIPQIVQDFINSNFPGYTLHDADMTTDCNAMPLLVVKLKDAQGEKLYVAFDLSGNQIYTATKIESSTLPLAVSNSLATNYPAYTLDNKAKQVELANGTIQYIVSIEGTNGQDDLNIWVTEDGTVICELED